MKKLFLVFISLLSIQLYASDLEIVTSSHDFNKSVEILKKTIQKMDLKLFAEIPHSKAAEKIGMKLSNGHLLLFGNPKVGTSIMQSDITAGIELPLKILIWENEKGKVLIGYKNPMNFMKNYELQDQKQTLYKIEQLLQKITASVKENKVKVNRANGDF